MRGFRSLVLVLVLCSGCIMCGYSGRDNTLVGQVKKVERFTPLICGDYFAADISLGVLRNGQGSLSKEDVWVVIENPKFVDTMQKALVSGEVVEVQYDTRRAAPCYGPVLKTDFDMIVTTVNTVATDAGVR